MTEKYEGPERRKHYCSQSETIGKFKEFMLTTKGFKTTLFTITLAICLQVGTFLYLWGGLTWTVKNNTSYLWDKLTPIVFENTRNIDRILSKMDSMKVIYESKADVRVRGSV